MTGFRRFLKPGILLGMLGLTAYGVFLIGLELSLRNALLEGIGIPWTWEHLFEARTLLRPSRTDDIPSAPEQAFFADGVAYEDLLADGALQVGIYREIIMSHLDWGPEFDRIRERAAGSGVNLRLLTDADMFREALQTDDLVIFTGHANLGQGLNVRAATVQTNFLWRVPGANILNPLPEKYRFTEADIVMAEMPEIHSRVFIHLGCRSAVYYHRAMTRSAPDTFFLFTQYDWSPGDQMLRALDLLCQTLEKRQSLQVTLEHWEELYASERLMGRARQARKFPDEKHFPRELFLQAPASGTK